MVRARYSTCISIMYGYIGRNESVGGMTFQKRTIKDIDVQGKYVLVRTDYNVAITNGVIEDDYKITASLPTIVYLLEHGAAVLVCSHMGRPQGTKPAELSLFPVAKRLQELLKREVEFVPECIGSRATKAARSIQPGQVLLLENLRFERGEEANDDGFAKRLAAMADVFVQDAFAVSYRRHASTDAITRYVPSVAGLLVEKEVKALTVSAEQPNRPLIAVIGGTSLSEKAGLLDYMIHTADIVAVGGTIAHTLLQASGMHTGKTSPDASHIPLAQQLLAAAAQQRAERRFVLYLPQDGVVSTAHDGAAPTRIVDWSTHVIADIENYPKRTPHQASQLHDDEIILDIGPFSGAYIAGVVQLAHTVIWSGTMGLVQKTGGMQGPVGPYSHGTELVVEAMTGQFGNRPPTTIVAGDDSAQYVATRHLYGSFSHVSTGGGASNELLAGHSLVGVEALQDIQHD